MRPMAISLLVPPNVSQSPWRVIISATALIQNLPSLEEGQGRLRLLCGTMSAVAVPLLCRRGVYCSPVLRHSAELIQAANFRSAVVF